MEAFAEEHGNSALYEKLQELDLETASRLHINDRRRIIRAIEAAQSGEKIAHRKSEEWPYETVVLVCEWNEKVYMRGSMSELIK